MVFFGTLSRESVLGSSIRQSRILAEGIPLAGNGKFPHISTKTIIAILHSAFFDTPSRESVLGSSIRRSRILAEGIPLAGNAKPYNSNNGRQKNMESVINLRIILKFDKNKPAYYP